MRLSTAAWAEVRLAFETGEPLAAIAAKWGVQPRTIQERARREGWAPSPKKPAPKKDVTHAKPDPRGQRRAHHTPARPSRAEQEALLARLYRAITWKLEDMEARMTSGDVRSAQDEEREARALGSLINTFEKVTDVVLDFDKSAGRGARPEREPGSRGANADEMRREIAERLERLNRGRNTGLDPRDP